MRETPPFAGNPLDRGERERRDEAWLEAAGRVPGSRFLPFRNLEVLLHEYAQPALGWLETERVRDRCTPRSRMRTELSMPGQRILQSVYDGGGAGRAVGRSER